MRSATIELAEALPGRILRSCAVPDMVSDGVSTDIVSGADGLPAQTQPRHFPQPAHAPWRNLSVWLVAFSAAVLGTQYLILTGAIDVEGVRQLTSSRSLSGAIIGGLVFGVGMILCRGCPSRLWVLAATGNLRALTTFMVFAGFVYLTLIGALNSVRQEVLQIWILPPDTDLNLISNLGGKAGSGVIVGGVLMLAALLLYISTKRSVKFFITAVGVGGTVMFGWWLTFTLSEQLFDPIPVESLSFTRPAYDVLQFAGHVFAIEQMNFGVGIMLGVLIGAFTASVMAREFKLQWFVSLNSVIRYFVGAVLMGFGAVVAGGCAVGAGVTGGSLFSITALISLIAMVFSAIMAKVIIDYIQERTMGESQQQKYYDIQPAE